MTETTRYEWWVLATPAALTILRAHDVPIYYGHSKAPYIVLAPDHATLAMWGIIIGHLPGHGSIDAHPDRKVMRAKTESPLPHESATKYHYGPEQYGGSPDAYWSHREEVEAEYRARAYPAEGILTAPNERRPVLPRRQGETPGANN